MSAAKASRTNRLQAQGGPCLALSFLAVLLLPASSLQAQACPEPALRDRAPVAEPMRLHRVSGSFLDMSWQPVSADSYRVRRGDLETLWELRQYSHVSMEEDAVSPARLAVLRGQNSYFLISATCGIETSSLGRSSGGVERPAGGMAQFTVEVSSAAQPLTAVQTTIDFSAPGLAAAEDLIEPVGPFAPGQPFSPFSLFNVSTVPALSLVGGQAFFDVLSEPTFTPPASVYHVRFGYLDAEPTVGDLSFSECLGSDPDSAEVADVVCTFIDFEVLY